MNLRKLVILMFFAVIMVSCGTKSGSKSDVFLSEEKPLNRIHYYNVEKTASTDSFAVFNTSYGCSIYEVNRKKFKSGSKFSGFMNAVRKKMVTHSALAMTPEFYEIGIIYETKGYKPIYNTFPIQLEAGQTYLLGYYKKGNRIYFNIENKTKNEVVLGRKYVPENVEQK